MERWRTRQNPLQSKRLVLFISRCPRVVCSFWTMCLSTIDNIEKVNKAQSTQVGPVGGNYIPTNKSIRVVLIASWHPSLSEEVLREESEVYTKEKQKEMSLSVMFWILTSCLFRNPKVKRCKNTKNCPHTQHVMKVPNNIVSQ